MECPKKYLLSTVIYLEKLCEKGYLPDNPDVKKKIAKNIAEDLIKYYREYQTFEDRNPDSDNIGVEVVSKSALYSINFNDDAKPKNVVLSKKNEYTVAYNVNVDTKLISNSDTEAEFREISDNMTFYTGKDKIVYPLKTDFIYVLGDFLGVLDDDDLMDEVKNFVIENVKKLDGSFIEIDDYSMPMWYIDMQEFANTFDVDSERLQKINEFMTNFYLNELERSLNSTSKHEQFAVLDQDGVSKHLFSKEKKPLKIRLHFMGKAGDEIIMPSLQFTSKGEKVREQCIYKFSKTDTDPDMPHTEIETDLTPEEIELNINLSKKLIEFKPLSFKEEVTKLVENNTAMNKKFFYPEETLNKFKTVVVDEADKNLTGLLANVFRKIGQGEHKNIVIATGSPIAGYGKDLVYLMGYSGELTVDAINENAANFNKLVGVYEVTLKEFAKIIPFMRNKEVDDALNDILRDYIAVSTAGSKEGAFNPKKFFEEKTQTFLNYLVHLEGIDTNKLYSIDTDKFKKDLERLIVLMGKKSYNAELFSDKFLQLSTDTASGIFKLVPSILNPKTMTGLVKMFDYSTSIMSRETLKERKEKMNFLDLNEFAATYLKAAETDKKKALAFNDMAVRMYYESAKTYAGEKFLNNIYFYSLNNFSLFVDALQNQYKTVAAVAGDLGYGYDAKEVKNLLSKSTVSGKDTMYNLYKAYLDSNGGFDEVKKLLNDNADEKFRFFKFVLSLYDVYMANLGKITASGTLTFSLQNNLKVSLKFKETNFVESFKNLFGEELPTSEINYDNGYPCMDNEPVDFVYDIDLCTKDVWKELLNPDRNGRYIPYSFRITNRAEEDIFDVLGSRGIETCIYKAVEKDTENGFVISSARTAGAVFNLLDTLVYLVKGKIEGKFDENKKINVIFNVPSSNDINAKEILTRIKTEALQKYGIEITPVSRTGLDSQLRASINKKYYTVVVSNYESVSRGLDLSALSTIVATGRMTKGKEFIQYLSRLFSVDKDEADIFMFHNGTDITVSPKKRDDIKLFASQFYPDLQHFIKNFDFEDIEDNIVFSNTMTNEIMKKSYDKIMTYNFFMSGERTGVINSNDKPLSIIEAPKFGKEKETKVESPKEKENVM